MKYRVISVIKLHNSDLEYIPKGAIVNLIDRFNFYGGIDIKYKDKIISLRNPSNIRKLVKIKETEIIMDKKEYEI